jgi:hypothetical protein
MRADARRPRDAVLVNARTGVLISGRTHYQIHDHRDGNVDSRDINRANWNRPITHRSECLASR